MTAMPIVSELPPAATPTLSFDMPREGWLELFADLADGRMLAFQQLYHVAARRLYALALWLTGSPEDTADVVAETIGGVVGVPTFTAASRYRLAISRLRRLLEDAP